MSEADTSFSTLSSSSSTHSSKWIKHRLEHQKWGFVKTKPNVQISLQTEKYTGSIDGHREMKKIYRGQCGSGSTRDWFTSYIIYAARGSDGKGEGKVLKSQGDYPSYLWLSLMDGMSQVGRFNLELLAHIGWSKTLKVKQSWQDQERMTTRGQDGTHWSNLPVPSPAGHCRPLLGWMRGQDWRAPHLLVYFHLRDQSSSSATLRGHIKGGSCSWAGRSLSLYLSSIRRITHFHRTTDVPPSPLRWL